MAASKTTNASGKITDVVHTLLDGLHSMSKSETVIGEPYTLGEATFVPVLRLRVALGAGSLHGGAKQDSASGDSVGLGAGGAVQIDPVAIIAVGRDGVPRIMCVESEEDAAGKLMKQLPALASAAANLLSERVGPIVNRFVTRHVPVGVAPSTPEALADATPPRQIAKGDG